MWLESKYYNLARCWTGNAATDIGKEVDIEEYYDDRADDSSIWYRKLYPEMKSIPKPDLPPGSTLGFQYRGLVGDPNVFLPWIFTTLQHMGVKFLRRSISTLQELEEATGAEILINASGLGARELASDSKVYPVRGQTMFVVCPDEDSVHYKQTVLLQGSQYTYAIPRKHSGGIILGGVSEPHDTSSAVSESTRVDILARVNKMTGGKFKWVDLDRHVRRDIVGFRPSREGGLRVERDRHVVHAYGAGGLGYLYAFGVAKEVRQLVSQAQRHSFAKL